MIKNINNLKEDINYGTIMIKTIQLRERMSLV